MQVEKYLQKKQPIIYKTFVNCMENHHLSHAYLLVGNPGSPLLETATFLGKSILCDSPSPLACENCITCLRIEDDNYPDFIVFDGGSSTIKKGDVAEIEHRFEKEALENKGIRVYILHLIENMSVEAINSILKFLEEPGSNIFAFLTTNNENSVLPTVISRCQKLYFKNISRSEVIKEAIALNIKQCDAELLSYFYNDSELIFDVLQDKEQNNAFQKAKEAYEKLLEAIANDDNRKAIYFFQKEISNQIKSKESARFFLDILTETFEDLLNLQNQKEIYLKSYDTILHVLCEKLHHIDKSLIDLVKQRSLLNLNINISLLLDHVILSILKE